MDLNNYTQINRAAWNEVMPIHQKTRPGNLEKDFSQKGFSLLDEYELAELNRISFKGKRVAQLSCNNGRELLSIVNLGAQSGTGFDIADEAIKEANKLRDIAGVECEFVCTNVYDISEQYHNSFDIVYFSIGALPWLKDLDKLFSIVASLLVSGGHLMIYESHPIGEVFAYEDEEEFNKENPYTVTHSYFDEETFVDTSGLDYYGNSNYQAKPNVSFNHTLSEIFNMIIANGIAIKSFNEYNHDISNVWGELAVEGKIPLSYILIGQKLNI